MDPQSNIVTGYLKLYRSLERKAWYSKSEYVHLFVHLLIKAAHTGFETWYGGGTIMLKPGQLVTGRKKLSSETGINESKIERILKCFENEQQIEQQTSSSSRLISITNWGKYQINEQRNEQRVNNDRTTGEQRVNTIQECQEGINENKVNVLSVAGATPGESQQDLRNEYRELVSSLTGKDLLTVSSGLREFISSKRPLFHEPYQEYWNLFAAKYSLPTIKAISAGRARKLKIRLNEPAFDFPTILIGIKNSELLMGRSETSSWKVSFDWIIENDKNYLKILEGNYGTAPDKSMGNGSKNNGEYSKAQNILEAVHGTKMII
jgi:hypothetical protein